MTTDDTTSRFMRSFEESRAFGGARSPSPPPPPLPPPDDTPSVKVATVQDDDKASSVDVSLSHKSVDLTTTKTLDSVKAEEGGVEGRGEWGNHAEYFLTSLGLAVGLGNIWRFPYVCFQNGGGTFLLPYLIMLLFIGLPMFFMEMSLGQFAGLSATKVYGRIAPGLKGLGYGMLAIPTIINFYYVVIMAWSFFYMFSGFTSELPWKYCDSDYNSRHCYSKASADECFANQTFYNKTCLGVEEFCNEFNLDYRPNNNTHCFDDDSPKPLAEVTERVSASEEFFWGRMLGVKSLGDVNTWESYGGMRWELFGCLALAWTVICLCLIKGIQSYGKVVYFITLFPYVVLTTFLIYVGLQDGFTDGVVFYLTPDWDKLTGEGWVNVWVAAAEQIFYSLGVGVGNQLLLSSYNKFNNNCHRDALLIGLGNSLTSIYAGFVVFGTLGMVAHNYKVNIEDVVEEGPGLAFIVYPEAVAIMEISPLFSFLFFFMLTLLALSSACGMWEPTVAAILDEFPKLRKYKPYVMIVSCVIGFLCGISCCFESGFLMFTMIDNRTASAILIMAFVEMVTMSWFYGMDKWFDDLKLMKMPMPKWISWFWHLCWVFITPVLIGVVIVFSFVDHVPDSINDYVFPNWVQAIGWCLELFPIAVVVIVAVFVVARQLYRREPWAFLLAGPMMSPSDDWGPREDRPKTESKLFGHQNLSYYDEVRLSKVEKTTEL